MSCRICINILILCWIPSVSPSAPHSSAAGGCGHDLALHDRENGACHAETFRKDGRGMKEWVGCDCRRYTGPTPLEEFFTPNPLPPAQ
jgi:hypothetical protein